MKKLIAVMIALILSQSLVLGQGAGNYFFNQEKSKADYAPSRASMAYDFGAYQQNTYYQPTVQVNDTSFSIQVSSIMNVKADEFVIIFGTSQIGETHEGCHELINKRIESFIQAAGKYGISPSDTYIDFISQFPIFEIEVEKKLFSKTYNEVPKGFEVKKNIHVRYKEMGTAEKLIVDAAKNEIFDIVVVDYIVNNHEAIYDTLRRKCADLIAKKLKDFEKIGIVTDSKYKLVYETQSSSFPIERYSTYAEFARYTGNTSKLGNKVITRYSVPALYYNRLTYKPYEIVVNPANTEPVVQFTYTLRVKYVLKPR